jgi:hypothetical protein
VWLMSRRACSAVPPNAASARWVPSTVELYHH